MNSRVVLFVQVTDEGIISLVRGGSASCLKVCICISINAVTSVKDNALVIACFKSLLHLLLHAVIGYCDKTILIWQVCYFLVN